MRATLLLLTLCLAAGGQDAELETGKTRNRPLRPSADPALQALLRGYEIPEGEFPWQLRPARAGEKVSQAWLSFPSAVQSADAPHNNTVWCRFWQPKEPARRRPAAVLLHWLGGSFETLELIGHRLGEQGIPTLMVYLPNYGPRKPKAGPAGKPLRADIDRMLESMRQSVLDVRRAGDWLAARPDVEPSRVGIVGISLGAVVGSLSAGVDDHFGRSVFLIGGGDLPSIILNGSKETAEAKARLETAGFTPEKLRELWRPIEPCSFASRVRPEEILLLNAEADEVIPRTCTERLRAAMGNPEIRWFAGGHYALLFQLGPALKDIVAHLSARTTW
jgi:dienelactone hydrolase